MVMRKRIDEPERLKRLSRTNVSKVRTLGH